MNPKVFRLDSVDLNVRIKMVTELTTEKSYLIESNRLDLYSAQGLEEEMTKLFQKGMSVIYIDFSNVEEVSSAVLGLFLYKKVMFQKQGVRLFLINVKPQIQKILKILHLSGHLLP
ncbi:Antagonist of anti-sigma factor [Leptospira biflexa serovar Patoc strain 'Patoc 1 (Ames)']|uniref:Putative anti-anti-sigma regulatory factor n=1 Tax=Leptospira biflexa serovar Patoc (strain Patoc 1 / ATCC 23582 / Paris) TaxID=456481 RepID=B0STD7_LEPBP|nr:STAS domain-containing protein [Leptospira biflexa]ABZ94711.1 Antagonist of anti-sigma factor [Leptospira biflexa serovar Patoc strain 'Patoc 1 (Ames)']ABZ98377.1 Putative anti-anti-sigma regulatory factor [Leptospira biflexa serovar Patoc strain 'Patoc 1 (Paris)']